MPLYTKSYDRKVFNRAQAAWFRSASLEGIKVEQPSENHSGLREYDGHNYAILRTATTLLAVYRINNAGVLKRLKRWPKALE